MSSQLKEARIVLAIEALRCNQKLTIHKAAQIYDVPDTTLRSRINGRQARAETKLNIRLLDELEEEVLI